MSWSNVHESFGISFYLKHKIEAITNTNALVLYDRSYTNTPFIIYAYLNGLNILSPSLQFSVSSANTATNFTYPNIKLYNGIWYNINLRVALPGALFQNSLKKLMFDFYIIDTSSLSV